MSWVQDLSRALVPLLKWSSSMLLEKGITMFHDVPTEHEVLKVLDCFLEVVVDLFIFFGTASVSLQVSWQIWSNGVQ